MSTYRVEHLTGFDDEPALNGWHLIELRDGVDYIDEPYSTEAEAIAALDAILSGEDDSAAWLRFQHDYDAGEFR